MHTSSVGTKLASERMELIANLIDNARTRSRLATQMTVTEDVFERDEINLVLDRKASEFARARDWLLNSGLDKREQAIMQEIAGFTGPALNIQRKEKVVQFAPFLTIPT
jgi:hypothetical protein